MGKPLASNWQTVEKAERQGRFCAARKSFASLHGSRFAVVASREMLAG